MKRMILLLSLVLCAVCLLSACGGGADPLPGTQPDDTAAVPTEPPTGEPTSDPDTEPPVTQADIPTEAPTETPTEPETQPVLRTVTIVNTVWEDIPPVVLADGTVLTANALNLPDGVSLSDAENGYLIPAGETFSGRFDDYQAVRLGNYIITEDITVALRLELRADDLSSLADTAHINYYGRNYIAEDCATFLNTASGFEVRFVGTQLTAVFSRRGPGPVEPASEVRAPSLIRIRVYVDGDMSPEGSRIITLDASTDDREIVLASFDTPGTHRVLVRKMNYDFCGYVQLKGLSCDGGFCTAPAKPETKFLIYGDSITVGDGVEYAAVGDYGGDVPEKEDGTRTWAALLADHYGAEIQAFCNTGVSLGIPCWRDKVIMQDNIWQQYCYFDMGSRYDMSSYAPDLIICNLGTNDAGGLANGGTSFGNGSANVPADFYKESDLKQAVLDFITAMRENYPDTPIIFFYGMMSTDPTVQSAIQKAMRSSGMSDIYYCGINTVEVSQNCGHPTYKGQADAFEVIRKFIDRKNILP